MTPFRISEESAAGSLSELLQAHLALDEAGSVRSRRFHVTAILSLPMAILAMWPELFSDVSRRAVLTFWALSACGAFWAAFVELRLRRAIAVGPITENESA